MADYKFYGMFTATKTGKGGLTPTCTVYKASDGSVVANAQAASEIGGGLYKYIYTSAIEDDYLGIFITADATVDFQHVPALASVAVPRIDAAVSTRLATAGYTTPPTAAAISDAVWEEATADHQTAGTTGKALTDASSAGDLWSAPVRTLTSSAAQTAATVEGDNITVTRGDTWTIAITGLGDLTGYVSLDFTVKRHPREADTAALVRVRKNASGVSDGLLTLNGATGTAAQGSITIDSLAAGNITLAVAAASTAQLEPRSAYYYDIQMITASAVQTLTSGELAVVADVTKAVS